MSDSIEHLLPKEWSQVLKKKVSDFVMNKRGLNFLIELLNMAIEEGEESAKENMRNMAIEEGEESAKENVRDWIDLSDFAPDTDWRD